MKIRKTKAPVTKQAKPAQASKQHDVSKAQDAEAQPAQKIKAGSMSEQYRFLWEPIVNAEKAKKKKK